MNKKIAVAITGFLSVLAIAFMGGCLLEVAEVVKPVPLVEPFITKHPASASYTAGGAASVTDLSVEHDGWDDEDGELTYQWYTFKNLVHYLNNPNDPAYKIQGATNRQYAPASADLTTTAGARNFFYVVVTSTNDKATDRQTASVRSAVAVISFRAAGQEVPVITRQPVDAETRFGRAVNPLSVRVADPISGNPDDLTYQWYFITLDDDGKATGNAQGVPDETAIAGATSSSFTPNPGDMKLDNNYFFVRVTVAGGGSIDSFPANIFVKKAIRAAAPEINLQPIPALYLGAGAVIKPLTAKGESTDFGTISYQWYYNKTGSNKSGTKVDDSAVSIDPVDKTSICVPTLTVGESFFYYVVITNTNLKVENLNESTASVASRAVNVRRATAASMTENATVMPVTTPKYQYIRGYGGMDVGWANFPETKPEETETQYDPDQLGYNILRIMIPLSNTNVEIGMSDLVNKRRQYYYENVKIVNKYGGYVEASPWSPPKEWKSNNSINGGGHLLHQYYAQFAAYLRGFAQHMYNHGAPIYCVSIQNEPNYIAGYDGCEWEPEEMRDFFKQVKFFTAGVKGWGGGQEIPRVLAVNGESANTPEINHAALQDPDAKRYIDLMARHVYGERRKSLWNDSATLIQKGAPTDLNQGKMEVWMTEHNINSANAIAYPNDSTWNYVWRFMNDIDLVIRLNNENAFIWWASKRFYSMIGDGQFGTREGVVLPRGWGLSHYAKYTIGMNRIGVNVTGTLADKTTDIGTINTDDAPYVNGAKGDMDNVTARITAFANDDNSEISMVLWTPTAINGTGGVDMGVIKVILPWEIGSVTAIRSRSASSGQNIFHEPYDVPVSADMKSVYIELPRSQIVSVKFVKQ
jgi:O-glycosyl hydrolase